MPPFLKLFLLFLITGIFDLQAQDTTTLQPTDFFGDNPGNLKLFLHNTTLENDTTQKPLVVVLHGCGQDAEDVARLTGWNKLADLNNFLVLYPQQRFVNNPNSCFNWFNSEDVNKGMGECESILQMIEYVCSHFAVDRSRVFITGLSAGGAMSVVMMATHPEVFRAGAVFAGGAYKIAAGPFSALKVMSGKINYSRSQLIENVREQNPEFKGVYPLLIVYQGLNDPIVDKRNAAALINQWTGINAADSVVDEHIDSFKNISGLSRDVYKDSSGTSVLIYYEVKDLGHKILVSPGAGFDEGGATGFFGVNRKYHSTFQTALDFGIVRKTDR